MTLALLYSGNADRKYPLSDFHTTDVPNDLILDISMSVPEGIEPVLSAARVGVRFAFLCFEDKTTHAAVASIMITDPIPARVYPLQMDVSGFGWVVFGGRSATNEPYFSGAVAVDLDPECWVALKTVGPLFALEVNGFPKEVANVLELASISELVTITVENGIIYLDRNDDVITEDDLVALNLEDQAIGDTEQILYTLDGVLPDADGNIDVDIVGCIQDCGPTRELSVPRSDTGLGEQGELPLDIYTPRRYVDGDPCAPSESSGSSSGSSAEDPFAGCTEIVKVDILDAMSSDHAVGTLYTVEEP